MTIRTLPILPTTLLMVMMMQVAVQRAAHATAGAALHARITTLEHEQQVLFLYSRHRS